MLTALAASDDPPTALAGYDRARRQRTQDMVRASARTGPLLMTAHPVTAWLRDLVVWALPTAAFLRATAGTFGWRPPADLDQVTRRALRR